MCWCTPGKITTTSRLNQVFFDDLGVRKPDYFLNSAEGSSGAAHTIGNLIIAVDKVLRIIHSYTDYVNRVVWKKY